jgi:hypothetical protein
MVSYIKGCTVRNHNQGVDVDWRDIMALVPTSSTVNTFIGALTTFVHDLGTEHTNFLGKNSEKNLFFSKQVLNQAVYN